MASVLLQLSLRPDILSKISNSLKDSSRDCSEPSSVSVESSAYLTKLNFIVIAFDVGRTLPNTDLSRDFMGLVVGRWILGRTSGIPR